MKCSRPLIAALLTCCLSSATVFAETETTPACTLADINGALSQDLTCSTDGTVFFGTDITQFVIGQCSGISTPDESDKAGKKRRGACFKCANKAWEAFRAAARAGLIHPTKSGGEPNMNKLHQLCKVSDEEDGGENDDSPPASDALQNMYGQLRLCLPQQGSTDSDPAQCVSCGTTVLDNALSASVINQAKYNVIKQYLPQACTRPPGDGDGEHKGPGTSPSATPTPPPGGSAALEQFVRAVGACVNQFHATPEACNSCVNAVPTEGVEPAKVQQVLGYAHNNCSGTFVPGDK